MHSHFDGKRPESDQLFKSKYLENLTRTHIAVPVTLFVLYSVGLLYWSISILALYPVVIVGLFLIGLLTFTWAEYQIHRHVFHMTTRSAGTKKLQHTIHGIHHDFPKNKERLAMPPVLSILIATGLLLILKLFLGDFAFAFLPGFLTGYAAYLVVHYILHAYPPPKNKFRILWIHHSIHHYKDSNKAFGVSSPLWDYIYRTMP